MSSYYFNQGHFIKSNEMILLKTFYLDNLNSAPHWCCKTVELTSISRSEMLQYIIKIVWGECSGESLVIEMNLRLVEHIRPTQINWWYFHVLVCSNPFQWSVFIFWTTLSQLHCSCLALYCVFKDVLFRFIKKKLTIFVKRMIIWSAPWSCYLDGFWFTKGWK